MIIIIMYCVCVFSSRIWLHHIGLPVGRVPMVLTSIVSPPGNHSVRIVASTGGESTVPYYIAAAATNGELTFSTLAEHCTYFSGFS